MTTRYSKFTRSIYLAGDISLLNIAFFTSHYFAFGRFYPVQDNYLSLLFYFNLTWVTTAFIFRIYDIDRAAQNKNVLLNLFKVLFLHVLLTTAFIVAREGQYYSRDHLLLSYAILTGSIIVWRLVSIYFFRIYRIAGGNYRRIIMIGYGETARDLKQLFDENPHYGYRFLGYFDDHTQGYDIKGKISDVKSFVVDQDIDEIYCSLTDIDNERVNDLIDFAEENLVRVKIIPDFRGINYRKIQLDFYEQFPIITFRDIPLDDILNKVAKRVFDIAFSLFILIGVGLWLFPLIALAIIIDSPGPVFFRQRRSGKGNSSFLCFKFRSMQLNLESDSKQATRNDERITLVGSFLRKTSLDEFPQFINVLLGDMSVVGPRPHPIILDENFKWIQRYNERQLVKPGITGLAQVKGYRGETSHPQLMQHRVMMDTFYIEKWTFLLDLKIITMTIGSLIKGDKNAF